MREGGERERESQVGMREGGERERESTLPLGMIPYPFGVVSNGTLRHNSI